MWRSNIKPFNPVVHAKSHPVVTEDEALITETRRSWRRRRLEFLCAASLLTVALGGILYPIARLSFQSPLHSHLPLIPIVSWFVWRFIDRSNGPRWCPAVGSRSTWAGLIAVLCGLASLGIFFALRGRGNWPVTEWLWSGVLAYLLLLLAAALWTVGWGRLREHKFALCFLLFAVPLPLAITDALSILLQRGSAEVTDWFLRLSGLPVLRDGLNFRLPTMTVRVAEECSGVRSTLVLFITSLLAGKMFLRGSWKRAALALATLPLGLLRNAFRITVLAWLSVNVDRNVIDGPLHHRGGPLFFALSLVPLFALLWWFRKSESGRKTE